MKMPNKKSDTSNPIDKLRIMIPEMIAEEMEKELEGLKSSWSDRRDLEITFRVQVEPKKDQIKGECQMSYYPLKRISRKRQFSFNSAQQDLPNMQ
jgi:hypothetical protein